MRTIDRPDTQGASGPRPARHSASSAGRVLARLASWRVVVVATTAWVVFAVVLFASSAPFSIPHVEAACGQAPPDVRAYTGPTEVHDFLEACGPIGREAYRNLQLADLVYPLVVGLALASALALALRHLFPRRPAIVVWSALPLLASGFDYLENLGAWSALAAYPSTSPIDALLGLASAAKTATSWLAGLTLVLALVALGVRAVRRRSSGAGVELRPTSAGAGTTAGMVR